MRLIIYMAARDGGVLVYSIRHYTYSKIETETESASDIIHT